MKPVLREISLTNGQPLDSFQPRSAHFETTVQLVLGSMDGRGEELFDFTVRNIAYASHMDGEKAYFWTEQVLLVDRFDPALILCAVRELLDGMDEVDWKSLVVCLRKFLRWEFDDYVAYSGDKGAKGSA